MPGQVQSGCRSWVLGLTPLASVLGRPGRGGFVFDFGMLSQLHRKTHSLTAQSLRSPAVIGNVA